MMIAFQWPGFDPNFLDYQEGLKLQTQTHEAVRKGVEPPTVLLCEHAPVYTAGRRTLEQELPREGTPVVPVDRGGKITWHGPGQLVGYPIVPLPYRQAIRPYVHVLEEALIRTLAHHGLNASRMEGRPGIWLSDGGFARKIGSIGIRVHQGVTLHGFALNCTNELTPFQGIVPCGISDASVTTMEKELGRPLPPSECAIDVQRQLQQLLPPFLNSRAIPEETTLTQAQNGPASHDRHGGPATTDFTPTGRERKGAPV